MKPRTAPRLLDSVGAIRRTLPILDSPFAYAALTAVLVLVASATAARASDAQAAAIAIVSAVIPAALILGRLRLVLLAVAVSALPLTAQSLSGLTLQIPVILALAAWTLLGARSGAKGCPHQAWESAIEGGLGACVVLACIAAIASPSSAQAIALAPTISGIIWAITLRYTLNTPGKVRQAIAAIGLAGVGVASIGFADVYLHLSLPGPWQAKQAIQTIGVTELARSSGPYLDYELYAEFLGLTFVILTWLSIHARHTRSRVAWIIAAGVVVASMVPTGTRGGAIVAVVGSAAVILASGVRRAVAATLMVTAIAVLVSLFVPGIQSSALFTRFGLRPSGGSFADILGRSDVWLTFINEYHPFSNLLLGRGLNYPYAQIGFYPHSLYLYMTYTVGLVGMLLFVGCVAGLAVRLLLQKDNPARSLAVLMGVILALFLLDQIKIEFFRLDYYIVYIWTLIGISLALARLSKSRNIGNAE